MAERTGPTQNQHRAQEDRVQDAYGRFIRHTSRCIDCRQTGIDCEDATELKQAWRQARQPERIIVCACCERTMRLDEAVAHDVLGASGPGITIHTHRHPCAPPAGTRPRTYPS